MNFLPGWNPGLLSASAAIQPASFVFNGTNEVLTRNLSTSGASTTIFTYSFWARIESFDGEGGSPVFQTISGDEASYCSCSAIGNGDGLVIFEDAAGSWQESSGGINPDLGNSWRHIVIRFDSTQGTADNRIRMYVDNTLLSDTTDEAVSLNEAHSLFANGSQHQIGAWLDLGAYFDGKLAFIDVLEGVSADPSAFAFNDGGTWTRMPYAGSYGTYGFSLDGTDGFNDVSGNGQNFTGTNMDASNLDTADLPPYTV